MKHIVNLSLSQAICYRKVLETWEVGPGVCKFNIDPFSRKKQNGLWDVWQL
jgi:hypothetical protein